MIQEEKQLLLQDLCARLPYYPKCEIIDELRVVNSEKDSSYISTLFLKHIELFSSHNNFTIKPYLRPMSSMTEDERKGLLQLSNFNPDVDDICDNSICCIERTSIDIVDIANFISWLNAHHFDYHGLIEKGLAIEITEENNPYEK